MRSVAVVRLVACVASIVAIALYVTTGSADAAAMPKSFAQAGNDAERTLLGTYYAGDGLWRACDSAACDKSNSDWGDDSATYALYLRWSSTHDARLASILGSLGKTGIRYGSPCAALPCGSWSDVPEWDTIALVRDYQATRDAQALERARAAFRFIDEARVFRLGACPTIQYQMPGGKPGYLLKTLETDANYIKAALLLYQATHESEYLDAAVIRYAAVRRYFLDPTVPLYSVYVYDDGRRCRQLPHRFFASVNGDMIWSGLALSRLTGAAAYRAQALKTAHAVDEHLCDAAGVFADLQAENDVEEPLVEAMYVLASDYGQVFARRWIARNAAAALSARAPDGAFERFWDGPPSRSASIPSGKAPAASRLNLQRRRCSHRTRRP
jgi:hypothetical protein